jgi:hypothetical protein
MLPNDQTFYDNITGMSGPEKQLLAFRACWERGTTYVTAIQQTAIGCALKLEGPPRSELDALCLALADVRTWFERCAEEYRQLESRITEGSSDSTVH